MNEAILHQAEAYRRRAEELRIQGAGTRNPECREALHSLANGYDRLAGNLERVASRSHRVSQPDGAYALKDRPRLVISR